jgi:hypothetical protein
MLVGVRWFGGSDDAPSDRSIVGTRQHGAAGRPPQASREEWSMRRLAASLAAAALTLAMASSAIAAPRSTFNGDFDILVDGNVVGHITAKLWSTDFGGPAGIYSSAATGLGVSQAQVGETAFYHGDDFDNVWFKALEIGYPGDGAFPGYVMFVGHFVDVLDPNETDYVEFWGQPLVGEPTPLGGPLSLGDPYTFRFDVGEGAFALHVAG